MRIAVVGSGYVGLVAGACFADLGHEVILVDNDQQKLAALRNGQVPIHEKFLPELLTRHRGQRLTFSDDLKESVRRSAAIFVAVGTPPTESGEADLSYVESVAREIYAPLTDGSYYRRADSIPQPDRVLIPPPIIVTSSKSAELIKHASNAFLAMKISFINAVASVCESVGANVNQVVHGVGTDSRIGPRFLNPGIGYGGSCFPKDVMAFRAVARESGYDFRLLDEVMRINEDQRQRFLRKIHSALWTIRGKNLAVLGLAFKGGTDDIRESPALFLVRSLLQGGSKITAYDPAAMERVEEVMPSCMTFTKSPYEAAHGADALLILTEWEEFANLDLTRLRQELKYPIVIDGRNLYDPEVMAAEGFTYYSVGRAAAHPDGIPAALLKNGKRA